MTRVLIKGDPARSKAVYHYDILGRRIEKQVYAPHHPEPDITRFEWNGMRLCGESSSKRPGSRQRYLYNGGGYEPIAQVDSLWRSETRDFRHEVFYYHTHLNGLPEEMSDDQGNRVWQGDFSLWGKLKREESPRYIPVVKNLRFQVQYYDSETGLHYNTFRYYDPEMGRFTQQDPIGLKDGLNLYQYAPNPLGWIDPLGLSPFTPVVLTEGTVYRQGSNTPANMTPRPGKDTNPLKKPGLSTSIEVPSGKSIPLDVAKLNAAGFDVIQDGIDHASIRPKNDARLSKLNEWQIRDKE